SGSEDFQDGDLVFQFPTCTDQFGMPADLNPEAKPFTLVEERKGQRNRQEIEETAKALPEEERVVDPVIPEYQSEFSVDHESENDEMDTLYLNTYPRRERHHPKILTYGSLGQPSVVELGVDKLNHPKTDCTWRFCFRAKKWMLTMEGRVIIEPQELTDFQCAIPGSGHQYTGLHSEVHSENTP
ncbi:hypothetical protein IRJ41_015734, partial [Triplophysa rosa]